MAENVHIVKLIQFLRTQRERCAKVAEQTKDWSGVHWGERSGTYRGRVAEFDTWIGLLEEEKTAGDDGEGYLKTVPRSVYEAEGFVFPTSLPGIPIAQPEMMGVQIFRDEKPASRAPADFCRKCGGTWPECGHD